MASSPAPRRRVVTLLALAASLALAAPAVDARPGGGGGMGSRGSKTFSAPPSTPTSPGAMAPIQRSQTSPSPGFNNPGMAAQNRGSRYGGGARPQPVQVQPDDFQAFERSLQEIQGAYGREDVAALRRLATPEMVGYFEEDLRANAARGVVNRISDVKLLQGDLSEAWREGPVEFATVAMRFSLRDEVFERSTNRHVENGPQEAKEFWTFVREPGGPWLLSAIQQGR